MHAQSSASKSWQEWFCNNVHYMHTYTQITYYPWTCEIHRPFSMAMIHARWEMYFQLLATDFNCLQRKNILLCSLPPLGNLYPACCLSLLFLFEYHVICFFPHVKWCNETEKRLDGGCSIAKLEYKLNCKESGAHRKRCCQRTRN